ncbi:hypothetical protein P106B_85 [Rhizobium phage vB_RglS_P106B]|uniref:Uncharacterized protein n=1 Tax=Rhizobium phage vB_RglS_P106B TaxID=1458697 RepID=W6E9U0_9CAUD|nr:hypothetical protein P106B_85 [Rhizobium phage vB_RglS_P106B]AHJ10768.1 hypothetical protein P106B_85 [Rhizobium phage vB_RglS_P106B]
MKQVGWAYNDKRWSIDRWHVTSMDSQPVAIAGRAIKPVYIDPIPTANCQQCGRIIDTREASEGGDDFGCETSPNIWYCSVACEEVGNDYLSSLMDDMFKGTDNADQTVKRNQS